MKIKTILCAVFAATLMGSCNYDDGELWDAVNGQEERISALEKWQKTVVEQLNSLQGILTATDYITNVEKVTKDGKEGYKISFLHAAPITLYYNDDKEVSGTGENVIGVAEEEGTGKWYWTLDGEALIVDGKTVYVNGGDDIKIEVNADGSTKLTIGDNEVTVPGPITHPVTGVAESGNVVTITLNGGKTIDVPKYLNLSNILLNEYSQENAGEQIYKLDLPDSYIIKVLDVISSDWTIEVTNSALRVVYPSSGETTITFLISDGQTQTVMKTVTFKAATLSDQWYEITYTKNEVIVIPDGVTRVKVTGTKEQNPGSANVFLTTIAEPLKKTTSVKNIDLSGLWYNGQISANGFLVNAVVENGVVNLEKSGENTSIETIILPQDVVNIFDRAFANCRVLKSITIPGDLTSKNYNENWFYGCTAFEAIYVAADKVISYQTKWSAVADKIKAIPAE